MTPERLTEEREKYAQARAGVVTQLLSLEQHAALAFLLEDPSDSELWDLPEVKEIIERNQEWVVREIDRCAYGRREQKPTKIPANIPKWVPKGGGNGRCRAGMCTGWLTPGGKTELTPGSDVPKQQGEEARRRGQERRPQREGAEGGKKTRRGRSSWRKCAG